MNIEAVYQLYDEYKCYIEYVEPFTVSGPSYYLTQVVCSGSIVVCSGSIVVTTLDPEVPGSSPEWVPVFYEARSTAQGLPEPSSLRGSTLGTSPVEHQDSDWV